MKIPKLKPGQWLVVRVDGTEEPKEGRPTTGLIHREIGAECCDSVILTFGHDRQAEVVMMVDDTGMIDRKPVNEKATALYHTRCKPGTVYAIHGDVAIVLDADFA
jgi:hypothetical protein